MEELANVRRWRKFYNGFGIGVTVAGPKGDVVYFPPASKLRRELEREGRFLTFSVFVASAAGQQLNEMAQELDAFICQMEPGQRKFQTFVLDSVPKTGLFSLTLTGLFMNTELDGLRAAASALNEAITPNVVRRSMGKLMEADRMTIEKKRASRNFAACTAG